MHKTTLSSIYANDFEFEVMNIEERWLPILRFCDKMIYLSDVSYPSIEQASAAGKNALFEIASGAELKL